MTNAEGSSNDVRSRDEGDAVLGSADMSTLSKRLGAVECAVLSAVVFGRANNQVILC